MQESICKLMGVYPSVYKCSPASVWKHLWVRVMLNAPTWTIVSVLDEAETCPPVTGPPLWNRLPPTSCNAFLSSNFSTSLAPLKPVCFLGANCAEKRFCRALCCEKRYINVPIQYSLRHNGKHFIQPWFATFNYSKTSVFWTSGFIEQRSMTQLCK